MQPSRNEDATRIEEVRRRYMDARRYEHTLEGIRLGRIVAEAVCAALIETVPEEQRDKYVATELGNQIETLERVMKGRRVARIVPKAVLAGLRTLQAYGNYAAHYEKGGEPQPPSAALESAMASLSLVAQWFLSRGDTALALDDQQRTRTIQMRRPELPAPRFFERRRVLWKTRLAKPEQNTKGLATPAAKLGSIYSYYSDAVAVCERICRVVIGRETELPVAECLIEDLPFVMEEIARERPNRVPRSIAADIVELWRRRAACERAIQERTEDVEPFNAEMSHRKIVDEVIRWFEHDYLCMTRPERQWGVWVVLLVFAGFFHSCHSDGIDAGRKQERSELVQHYCADASARATPICVNLLGGKTP